MPLRDLDQLGPRPVLDVRGVDDGQAAATKAHLEQPMQEVERVIGRALGRGIVRDQGPECVGREDLGRREVPARQTSSSRWRRCRSAGRAHRPGGRSPEKRTDRRAMSAVGGVAMERVSALRVAVRAHLRVGNRGLRLADRARQSASADRGAGLTDEVDLAEVAIRQAPRHITALANGGRGHRAGTPCADAHSARNRSFSQTGAPIWQHGR